MRERELLSPSPPVYDTSFNNAAPRFVEAKLSMNCSEILDSEGYSIYHAIGSFSLEPGSPRKRMAESSKHAPGVSHGRQTMESLHYPWEMARAMLMTAWTAGDCRSMRGTTEGSVARI